MLVWIDGDDDWQLKRRRGRSAAAAATDSRGFFAYVTGVQIKVRVRGICYPGGSYLLSISFLDIYGRRQRDTLNVVCCRGVRGKKL